MKRKRIFRAAIVVAFSLNCPRTPGGEPTPRESGPPEPIVVRVPGTVDDPTLPRTVITPVLHSTDPAPGIPNASIVTFIRPAIDGAGNVLFWGQFRRDGEPFARSALWYGQPGKLVPIMYDGMPAPHFPPGVEIGEPSSSSAIAENGMLALTVGLRGPGITAGFNDRVIYVGWPGRLRKGLQGGDPAPGTERGTIIDLTLPFGFGAQISDNGVLMVLAYLSGSKVDDTNDRAMWIGPHGDLKLVWRKGMIAPGTNGARFRWADSIKFNHAEQVAFRGGLVHEHGVGFENGTGYWWADDGQMSLVARGGDQAAELPPGVLYRANSTSDPAISAQGSISYLMGLTGTGATPDNDIALWVIRDGTTSLVARKGDPAPLAGQDVALASVSHSFLGASERTAYGVKYRGPAIDATNAYSLHLGDSGGPAQSLRDGDTAPAFDPAARLYGVGAMPSELIMNDPGDVVAPTEIVGSGVGPLNRVVLWQRDDLRDAWFPILRTGMDVGGQSWFADGVNGFDAYWSMTGGSDGERQSFNDARELALILKMVDGSKGIFVVQFDWLGDTDGDADVDLIDFAAFQRCFAIAGDDDCVTFDFDESGEIDETDYGWFARALTGLRTD
ncbi:MAG: hypothetical protein HOP29_03075 [Phycisphaerales bacterium]|nr:hypothetical protein [Phycisphaerales bacterium]